MLTVAPDFARRIDLPGAGPCPRPIDIDQARSGLTDLVSLRVYSFARGMVIDGEAEADEVFVTLMRGRARIAVEVDGAQVADTALDTAGGPRTIYLPPHAGYHLTATDDCDIAYARARPDAARFPHTRLFAPERQTLAIDDHALGMTLTLAALAAPVTHLDGSAGSERFVHVRSDDGGAVTVADARLGDWDAAVLAAGDAAPIVAAAGTADVLVVAARKI